MNKLIHAAAVTLTLLSVTGLSASASAADQPIARATKVGFSDLNLASAEGQRVAYERVHKAARDVCSRVADNMDLSHQTNYVACIDAAIAKAVPSLQALANRDAAASVARNATK